jgi:hypothetical protein
MQPVGRRVHPGVVVALSIVTLGIYVLVYWWRVSRRVGQMDPPRSAHRLMRIGILIEGLAMVTMVAAYAIGGLLTVFLVLRFLVFPVFFAGDVVMSIAQWRTLRVLRGHEVARAGKGRISPTLYVFLPIGLSFGGVIPAVGILFVLAGLATTLFFMGQVQRHLNDL